MSLDGATAATNDAVRGPGTFDRVLERLAILARHARFTLAFTVMRSNLREVRESPNWPTGRRQTAVFRPLYPVGVAGEHPELMTDFAEYLEAVDDLTSLGSDGWPDLRAIEPFGPVTREPGQSVIHNDYGCGAGRWCARSRFRGT